MVKDGVGVSVDTDGTVVGLGFRPESEVVD